MDTPPDEPEITTERPATPRRPETIEELMNRLAEGDDSALGPLFDAIAPTVRRYIATRTAADRIDETMRNVLLGLRGGRSTYLAKADVMTWAFSFARFLVKDDTSNKASFDDDVHDLLRAGVHLKQVATILDVAPATVKKSLEKQRQHIEQTLETEFRTDKGSRRMRPRAPAASAIVGECIDRYRIDEHIGSGGFGHVYRATSIDLGLEVAIKVMRDIPDDDGSVERLKTEARWMRQVGEHPNVVPVYRYGELPDGRAWYAMKLLNGKPLNVIVGHGQMHSWKWVVGIVQQLCDALAVVHGKQIVHGDVKPANCFLDEQDGTETLRLLDFGLAKRACCNQAHRPGGGAAPVDGTARYLAPELLRGAAADERADIYAIGVMMFEMLTGRAPFAEESLIYEKLALTPPTLAAASGRKFSAGVEAIVSRAMRFEPAQRFASVGELLAAIRALSPSGRRNSRLWSFGRDSRVRVAATASISALAASLVTAAIVTESEAGSTPYVERLTTEHVEVVVAKARPRLAACREERRDSPAPERASLRILGATGQVTLVPKMNAHADGPVADCMRGVLRSLRFPRFEVGEAVVGVDL